MNSRTLDLITDASGALDVDALRPGLATIQPWELSKAADAFSLEARIALYGGRLDRVAANSGLWPFKPAQFRPAPDPSRNLATAAAFLAAAIDRLS